MNISTYSRSQLRKLEKKRKNRSCLMVYLGSLSSNDVLKCRGKSRAQESRFTWMKDVFWCRFIHQQEKKGEIWETLSFLLRIVLPSYFAEPNVVKRLTLLMPLYGNKNDQRGTTNLNKQQRCLKQKSPRKPSNSSSSFTAIEDWDFQEKLSRESYRWK